MGGRLCQNYFSQEKMDYACYNTLEMINKIFLEKMTAQWTFSKRGLIIAHISSGLHSISFLFLNPRCKTEKAPF